MQALSPRSAWTLFLFSIALLGGLAFVANRGADRYTASERWVSHTREVEWHVALLRSDLAFSLAGSNAKTIPGGTRDSVSEIATLKRITADNPLQQEHLAKLAALQPATADSNEESARNQAIQEELGIVDQMQREEEQLLTSRQLVSESNYLWLRAILTVAVLFVLGLICFVFSTLLAQLALRAKAERAVRKLSARILSVQDTERRRLARELHDGLGQMFAGIKMELDILARTALQDETKETVENCRAMAAEGLSQTRTISYLLHPPMLDDLGFEHAVKWYVEGFSNRSNVDVRLKFSEPFQRLPKDVELALFRVVQESLGNIHRHSGSKDAEINVTRQSDAVRIFIRDFGKGIPEDLLRNIEETSAGAGVGLGGMRERISEFEGTFSIASNPAGTTVYVSIPLGAREEAAANGDSHPRQKAAAAGSLEPRTDETDGGALAMAATC